MGAAYLYFHVNVVLHENFNDLCVSILRRCLQRRVASKYTIHLQIQQEATKSRQPELY